MTKQSKQFFGAMLICWLVSTLIGWMSGYNFDHRDGVVGLWAVVTLVCSFPISIAATL